MAPVGAPLEVRTRALARETISSVFLNLSSQEAPFQSLLMRGSHFERCSYRCPELSVTMLANMTLPGNNDVAA